jgi:hypothetical protein
MTALDHLAAVGRFVAMVALAVGLSMSAAGLAASCATMPAVEKRALEITHPELGQCVGGGARSQVTPRYAVGMYALTCLETLDAGTQPPTVSLIDAEAATP